MPCLTRTAKKRLKDHIEPEIRILFVGINPGLRSAQTGHHFAGYSNRFWKLLYKSGLVSEPLTYSEDWRLPEWKLGLTNLIGRCTAGSADLQPHEYQRGLARLEQKIRRHRPQIVAFLGVTIFRMLFPTKRRWAIGATDVQLANVPVFLLPNPSGRNAHYSEAHMLRAFRNLRRMAAQPMRGLCASHE
jgi:double-stranded uracil-DNA glycosylase